jgi:thioredoxin-like negative regulator of GroEL
MRKVNANELESITRLNELVVLKISIVPCPACDTQTSILEGVIPRLPNVLFLEMLLNEQENMDYVSANYMVHAVPTMLFIQHGVVVHKLVGVQSEKTITTTLEGFHY